MMTDANEATRSAAHGHVDMERHVLDAIDGLWMDLKSRGIVKIIILV